MNSKLTVVIFVTLLEISNCDRKCGLQDSIDISKGTHHPNGVIYYNGDRYDKTEYFIDNGIERGCFCLKKNCIRKCCPKGQAYVTGNQCVNVTDPFEPEIWEGYRRINNANVNDKFNFMFGRMECQNPEVRIGTTIISKHIHLRTDGKIYVELPGVIKPWVVHGPDKYCIDTFATENPDGNITTQLSALICFAKKEDDNQYVVSSSCMLISCVFFLVTVAVYAWLPELRNLHGRVLMAYLLCLFVGFLFLSIMQILLTVDNISSELCVGLTFIIYFFLESAFFWLNVMCFDIWWTFSGKRGLALEKLSTRARFCAYATYAFTIPTVLTIILATLEFANLPRHPLLPMIKYQGCFLYGTSRLIYLYVPIIILCIANIVFFILTAMKIAQIKKQTSVLKSKESSTHDQHKKDKQRLLLYVKLFAVMGINWVLEVISAIYPEAQLIWNVTDVYNVLIGFIIFVIFVCKRKIFQLIKKRIKESFHLQRSDTGELKNVTNKNIKNSNIQHQRASLDTIRTSLDVDNQSIRISQL